MVKLTKKEQEQLDNLVIGQLIEQHAVPEEMMKEEHIRKAIDPE